MKTQNATFPQQKRKRGFTLVEIIIGITVLGILGGIGYSLMKDTAVTSRTNALASNANEINQCMNTLTATGGTFPAPGVYALTNGTTSTPSSLRMPTPATPADVATLLTQLSGAGITCYGHTATLTKAVTAASYTYTLNSRNVPVFTVVGGAITP